jgi:hypothetical protein
MKPIKPGDRFGHLTVIAASARNRRGTATWLCRCDSGGTRLATGSNLRHDNVKSCGCRKKQTVIHGQSLCWGCQRASEGPHKTCPWSARFEPVPGWTAAPTRQKCANTRRVFFTESYCVTACPLFLPDEPRKLLVFDEPRVERVQL